MRLNKLQVNRDLFNSGKVGDPRYVYDLPGYGQGEVDNPIIKQVSSLKEEGSRYLLTGPENLVTLRAKAVDTDRVRHSESCGVLEAAHYLVLSDVSGSGPSIACYRSRDICNVVACIVDRMWRYAAIAFVDGRTRQFLGCRSFWVNNTIYENVRRNGVAGLEDVVLSSNIYKDALQNGLTYQGIMALRDPVLLADIKTSNVNSCTLLAVVG